MSTVRPHGITRASEAEARGWGIAAPAPDPVKARTALQEAFAVEYCVDHNATAAYKRAKGGNVGTAAKKVASELLHLPQVQARIAELESAHLGDAKRRKEIRIGALLRTALDPDEGTANRLRAIELSGKIDGDFTERLETDGTVPDAEIPATIARDADVTAEATARAAADTAEATARAAADAAHLAAADPHAQYQRESEKDGANGYLGGDANARLTSTRLSMSATDKVLGRSSAGAGASEEIPCTASGRAMLAAATAIAQAALLGITILSVALANNATQDITMTSGLVWISDASSGTDAIISVMSGAVRIIGQEPSNEFFPNTSGHAATSNVFKQAAGTFRLENKLGATKTYHIIAVVAT
jgi:hypothetical protein